jgi:hypothetical protein
MSPTTGKLTIYWTTKISLNFALGYPSLREDEANLLAPEPAPEGAKNVKQSIYSDDANSVRRGGGGFVGGV